MRIIISPAKKMRQDPDGMPWQTLPAFLDKTQCLLDRLREMSPDQLRKLWKCSESIAKENVERLQTMELTGLLTPAILAYEGIQYRYMAPTVFTDDQYAYVQEHLRILSGFYGLLRPFDGVVPYRLEMQAKLAVFDSADLYGFWAEALAKALFRETDTVIDLASKEYSACITPYVPDWARRITCVFAEEQDGRQLEKGTLCKMARGEMVRYLAVRRILDPAEIIDFHGLGFAFDGNSSSDHRYVFLRRKKDEHP